MPKPSWFDWITLAALLLGPVFALAAQRLLDRIREKKQRRVLVYTTLMSLRAQPLHPDHVRALNSIDAIFDRHRDKEVRECWGRVLAHISTDTAAPRWNEILLDLRVDLYQAVGKAVGYDHTIDYIKNRVYIPIAYNDLEGDQLLIRRALAKAVTENGVKVILKEDSEGGNTPPAPQN
jgi:hypothetical protein